MPIPQREEKQSFADYLAQHRKYFEGLPTKERRAAVVELVMAHDDVQELKTAVEASGAAGDNDDHSFKNMFTRAATLKTIFRSLTSGDQTHKHITTLDRSLTDEFPELMKDLEGNEEKIARQLADFVKQADEMQRQVADLKQKLRALCTGFNPTPMAPFTKINNALSQQTRHNEGVTRNRHAHFAREMTAVPEDSAVQYNNPQGEISLV